ncbi:MAG TPA: hypothetical protein VGM32_19095 [Rhodopila sp.]|jgi:hypothetical protein
MLAVGCLIPFVMLAVGAGLGSYLGDVRGGYLGAGVGFGAGLLIAVVGLLILDRARAGG